MHFYFYIKQYPNYLKFGYCYLNFLSLKYLVKVIHNYFYLSTQHYASVKFYLLNFYMIGVMSSKSWTLIFRLICKSRWNYYYFIPKDTVKPFSLNWLLAPWIFKLASLCMALLYDFTRLCISFGKLFKGIVT